MKRNGNALDEHKYLQMMIETAATLGFAAETLTSGAARGAIIFRNGPVSYLSSGISGDSLVWRSNNGLHMCHATPFGVRSLFKSAIWRAVERGITVSLA